MKNKSKKPIVFDAEARKRYIKARRKLREKLRPMTKAIEDAHRLSAADYDIRINC